MYSVELKPFTLAILKEVQALQKNGLCRNLNACEYIRDHIDCSEYDTMQISQAADMILALIPSH